MKLSQFMMGAARWGWMRTGGRAATTTANAAEQGEMRLSAAVSTANIAAVPDGAWALIAPYGVHPSPDGSYVQSFTREQAQKVVGTWNSVAGTAARWLKNLTHGRMSYALPVWDGHPDSDKKRWPKEKLIADVTDLRTGNDGLEGKVTWNAKGAERRNAGPLFPSPLWWHWPPKGEPPTVYPELLESIGLVPTPNISSVPAWTANAVFDGEEFMTDEQARNWAALRSALGLAEGVDAAGIIAAATTANAAVAQLTERETALTTANSARVDLETKVTDLNTQLTTANGQVTTITTERDTLQTVNASLITERDMLRKGVLDLAEKKGAFTPAERKDFETKLSTANTAAATITELQTRKALNTTSIEVNGSRLDLSTANSRQEALQAEVAKRLPQHNGNYDAAYAAVKKDPTFAPLFDAMQDPTKAK